MKAIERLASNASAMIVSAIIVGAVVMWQNASMNKRKAVDEAAREAEPVENWLVVRNVAVPRFNEGTDPLIVYEREIRQPFIGDWIVEVHEIGNDNKFPICSGSGRNRYTPEERLPIEGVTLSWYVGRDCKLKPGQYIMETAWTVRPNGYPDKRLSFTTSPFVVMPEGATLYITPEQVQKMMEPTQ